MDLILNKKCLLSSEDPLIWHLPWKCKQRFSVSLMLSQRSQEYGHENTSTQCDYISSVMSCLYVLKPTSTLPPLRNDMNCPNQSLPLYSNWSTLCNGPYNGFWRYTRWHIHHTISSLSYDVWPSKVNYELSFCHILEAIMKYLLCIYVGSKCRQEFLIGKWLWNS